MDTKISALTDGVAAASTDRFPVARSPFASGDNVYLTPAYVGTYLAKNTLAAGTITTSQPMSLTQTWNAGAVTFTGLVINITDTASAAASKLLDMQVGGVSKVSIGKTASLIFDSGTGSAVQLDCGNSAFIFGNVGTPRAAILASGFFNLVSTGTLQWTNSSTNPNTTTDLVLARDAAGILGLRNSTNPQSFYVYGTYTNASNYEHALISADGSAAYFGHAHAGTGAVREIRFLNGGTVKWRINTSGHLLAQTDNLYDIGASGATRPRDYFGAGKVTTSGQFISGQGTADSSLAEGSGQDSGFGWTSNGPAFFKSTTIISSFVLGASVGGDNALNLGTYALGWAATPVVQVDLALYRGAANILEQRNGTNAQTMRIYNTFTNTSNYEYGMFQWGGSEFNIRTEFLGTGVARNLCLGTGGTNRWRLTTAGHLHAIADNTYDIGASGATRPRTGHFATSVFAGNVSAAVQTLLTFVNIGAASSGASIVAENINASGASSGGVMAVYCNDGVTMASGDRLGLFLFGGSSSAAAVRNSASLSAFASEAWVDATAYGSRFELQTTTNGATARSTKLILGNAGILTFGATEANTVPALKPNSTVLETKLGDDSAYAYHQAAAFIPNPTATGSLPGSPPEGAIFYDTTLNKLKFWNGAAYEAVTSV